MYVKSLCVSLTHRAEVEEQRQLSAAGQASVGLAQFIEERVGAGLERRETSHGRVFQQTGTQRDGLRRRPGFKHLNIERAALLDFKRNESLHSQVVKKKGLLSRDLNLNQQLHNYHFHEFTLRTGHWLCLKHS